MKNFFKNKIYLTVILASLSLTFILAPQHIQAQTGNLPMPDYCKEPKKTELQNKVAKWQKVLDDINQISGTGWVTIFLEQTAGGQTMTMTPLKVPEQTLQQLREWDEELEGSRQNDIDDIATNPQGWFIVDDIAAWFLESITNEGILIEDTESFTGGYSKFKKIHIENARSTAEYKLVYIKSQLNNCNRWEDQAIINNPNSTSQDKIDAQGRIDLGRAQMTEDLRSAKTALEFDTDSVQSHALDDNRCFYKWGIHPWNCVLDLTTAISNLLLKIFGTILWATGSLLDLSIFISITKFKEFVIDNPGFDYAWRIMRDLANLSFIFILLYIAIGTIFDIQAGNRGKKLIIDVIIIALLVNFSGFFVRVVVDASNIVAYEFYSRMSYDQDQDSTIILPHNIGTALAAKLHIEANMIRPTTTAEGVSNLDNSVKMDITQPKRMGFVQLIIAMLGNILIILSVSFVFLVAAIMFIIRSVVLALVYIFAPIAFIARLIPPFESAWKKWYNALFQQSFYAPAFLIPLYAVFIVLGPGLTRLMGSIKSSDSWGFYDGGLTVAVFQGIIIAMIVSCIFIAQKFSAYGTGFATKWAGKGVNLLSKPAVGTTKLLGKGTLNVGKRTGIAFASSGAGKSIAKGASTAGSYIASTRVAQGATKAAKWTANTAAAKAVGSSVASGAKNLTKDFKSATKDKFEHPLLYASDVISASASKIGGVDSFNIMGATREERKKMKDDEKQKKQDDRRKNINEGLATEIKKASENPPTADSFLRVQEIVKDQIGNDKEVLKLIDIKPFADSPEAACALDAKQLNAFAARNDEDFAKYKSKIRGHILSPSNQAMFGILPNNKEVLIAKSVIWQ